MQGRRSNHEARFFVFPTGEQKTAQYAIAAIGAAAAGAGLPSGKPEPRENIPGIVH